MARVGSHARGKVRRAPGSLSRRRAKLQRKTRETQVEASLVVDGSGRFEVSIPQDRFLAHMTETLARYAGWDLALHAQGDLDHHLVEDVAITLGRALRSAIGTEAPIVRFGSATVPFDEALVAAHVDLVDRAYAVLEVPDELYEHFLRSLAFEGKFTLHTQRLRGTNKHHIIEGSIKATGMALRQASALRPTVLSTKGTVANRA